MPRPVRFTYALTTADADNIAASQTPAAAGNLTLNGVAAAGSPAIATLDAPRQVLVTTVSDESGKTLTIYGFDKVSGGNLIQETMTGPNATTGTTTLMFGQVTRVAVSAAFTGAVTVGTNGVGATPWQLVDNYLDPTSLRISVDVVGTVDYTVQYTDDNIMGEYTPNWANTYPTKIWDDPVLAAVTVDGQTAYSSPITAWRVTINSGTGSLRITGVQAGVGGLGS